MAVVQVDTMEQRAPMEQRTRAVAVVVQEVAPGPEIVAAMVALAL